MRRLFFLLILAALLAGVIALNRVVTQLNYIVPPDEGALLYAAGFDSFDDEWEQYTGRGLDAQIADGVLRVQVDDVESSVFVPARPHFADFELTVDTVALDGPENNSYGVIFRAQDTTTYYYFLISSDGYYQVQRVIDGVSVLLSNWIPSDAINVGIGEPNRVRVVGAEDRFRFYVNDTPLELCIPDDPDATSTFVGGACIDGTMTPELTDAEIRTGQLGVTVRTLNEPGVVVAFDDFVVMGPPCACGE